MLGNSVASDPNYNCRWLDSGWWDYTMWASLSSPNEIDGLAVLVATACGMATTSSDIRPRGVGVPCPPVKSIFVLTNQFDLAVSMVLGWAHQHSVPLDPLPQVTDVVLDEDYQTSSRFRIFGGIAKCDFDANKTSFEGTDGRELIIAPPTYELSNPSVVLVLESESRLDPWERTNWQLKSNGTPGLLTLVASQSNAFLQCKTRIVKDGDGQPVLCVGPSRCSAMADALSPLKARKAFYGLVLGKIARTYYPELKQGKRLKVAEVLDRHRAEAIANHERFRAPYRRKLKPWWHETGDARQLRIYNPRTLGRVNRRIPTSKQFVEMLRKHNLYHGWLDAGEGWRIMLEKPRPRCRTTFILSPPSVKYRGVLKRG